MEDDVASHVHWDPAAAAVECVLWLNPRIGNRQHVIDHENFRSLVGECLGHCAMVRQRYGRRRDSADPSDGPDLEPPLLSPDDTGITGKMRYQGPKLVRTRESIIVRARPVKEDDIEESDQEQTGARRLLVTGTAEGMYGDVCVEATAEFVLPLMTKVPLQAKGF